MHAATATVTAGISSFLPFTHLLEGVSDCTAHALTHTIQQHTALGALAAVGALCSSKHEHAWYVVACGMQMLTSFYYSYRLFLVRV